MSSEQSDESKPQADELTIRRFENIRTWLDYWGPDGKFSWEQSLAGGRAGVGGTIMKSEFVQALELADRTIDAEQNAADEKHDKSVLMSMLSGLNHRCLELEDQREKLLDQLEKASRFDAFETAIDMLRRTAHDPGAARNYVQCELIWEHALAPTLPFKRACIAFVRDGAKNPAELVRDALVAKARIAKIAREAVMAHHEAGLYDANEYNSLIGTIRELENTPEANPPLGELPKS